MEEIKELELLINSGKDLFNRFKVKSKKKSRNICAPNKEIREVQRRMLIKMYDLYEFKDMLITSYRPGVSVKDTAICHANNKYMLSCDFSKYFDTIPDYLIREVLEHRLLCDSSTEEIDIVMKTLIDTETEGLCQGSPLSGLIANIVIEKPARDFEERVRVNLGYDDVVISFYSDDVVISSSENIYLNSALIVDTLVECMVNYTGVDFKINERKTRFGKHNARKILGMAINHKNEITISRSKFRALRSVLYKYITSEEEITWKVSTLRGRLSHSLFVDTSGKVQRLVNKMILLNKEKMVSLLGGGDEC